ncbi:N N'-diacetylbacillosaminyl-diphospho-undecaprenol alpha-1 3-N-acetylgalactosaminyltransferase [termite gut metagenome]|uniref:N N'-diacetylbacillosaminyl-diphospho-undecaprenol alpha-1 3-N-acetylgalactosaminyltransferase n=1 Tax=termite gut metagenome TaxID=433724 RepID=A0A5J4QPG6_9ZZZZ
MRVLLVNTSERVGGAAVASYRLTEALKNNGVKAKLLVRNKQTDNVSTVELEANRLHLWKFVWERIVIWKANHFKKNNLFAVDIANTGTDITSLPEFQEADVIHLHWINQGMLSLKNIRKIVASGKPIVWTKQKSG